MCKIVKYRVLRAKNGINYCTCQKKKQLRRAAWCKKNDVKIRKNYLDQIEVTGRVSVL